jgi:4-amino-4-deoxy-L-arabinose transferase-like glycosyltransferase
MYDSALDSGSTARLQRALQSVLLLAALLVLVGLLWNHYQLISYPTPLDYNEGGMQAITETIASGSNPYSLESQPARISVYPPLYNLITVPISAIFGNTLLVHRAVVGFFILASVMLCFFVTYRVCHSLINSLAASVVFFAGLLYYSTPIASPNSVGLFFFLLSVAVPWRWNFSNRSLACALVLGILAFYSKQYFVAGLGYVGLYLFLFVSKKKGILFSFSCLFCFLFSLFLVQINAPFFIDDIIFSVKGATGLIVSNGAMLDQLQQFAKTFAGLFILAAAAFFMSVRRFYLELKKRKLPENLYRSEGAINVSEFDPPLIGHAADYFWFCFACSLAIIVFVIGRNPGNHMTYLFQLMSPFLLIATFRFFSTLEKRQWLALPLVLSCLYSSYAMLPKNFSSDVENWHRLGKILDGKPNVYASPVALPFLIENGNEIHNNGHSVYFIFSDTKPGFLKGNAADSLNRDLWESYVAGIYDGIESRKFDLIILDQWTKLPGSLSGNLNAELGVKLLQRYYKRTEKFSISLADRPGGGKYTLHIWEPKPPHVRY